MIKKSKVLSKFKLERFSILESHFKVIPVKSEKELPELPVEVNFETFSSDPNFLRIIVKIEVNKEGSMPGYSFEVVADGIFSFPEKSDEKERATYTNYSGLPLIINSIRAYIMNISSYSFYGQYTLPLIDINNILDKKSSHKK